MAVTFKPDHNGAKNGGGFWGTRLEAKTTSKRIRRFLNKKEAFEQLKEYECCANKPR